MASESRSPLKIAADRARATGPTSGQPELPDTTSPEFIRLAHEVSLAIANSPHEQEDQDFIDSISILRARQVL